MGQGQRQRGEEESKDRGAARRETTSADKEREAQQREGKKVCVAHEKENHRWRREQ